MGDPRMLRLPARVVFETMPSVLPEAAAALASGEGEAAIDLAGCEEFDSSLLALLLELSRLASGRTDPGEAGPASMPARPLRVFNPPPNLRKLAALYGVDEMLFERD
ncbi:MAG TPA: STAS domain-containing protein [Quisquiliibacterium sp.]|nr:STAS domain-containing protein [Quisquiliibacterium sp.]